VRLEQDLAEAEGPLRRCCVYKEFYESVLVFGTTLAVAAMIVLQFGFIQRIQLTQGTAFPMFLEGTCTCGGELCANVVFTLNLTDERLLDSDSGTTDSKPAVEYWDAWNMTNEYLKLARNRSTYNNRSTVNSVDGTRVPAWTTNGMEDMSYCVQDNNSMVTGGTGSSHLRCRGGLDEYLLLLLPVEGQGRRSLDDNACWTREPSDLWDADKPGPVEPWCEPGAEEDVQITTAREKCDSAGNCVVETQAEGSSKLPSSCDTHETRVLHQGFTGSTTVLGSFSVAGSVVFICLVAMVIAWQDFISAFAPHGHRQAGLQLKEKQCKPRCKRLWAAACCRGRTRAAPGSVPRELTEREETWLERASGASGEFLYYCPRPPGAFKRP
jgi:hypothetical protein